MRGEFFSRHAVTDIIHTKTDSFYENRSSVDIQSEESYQVNINITINGIGRADNGSYVLELHPYPWYFCWILFVMGEFFYIKRTEMPIRNSHSL